jgi:hypothetical protein
MKYLAYFATSALVIAALLGFAVLADSEWLLSSDLVPSDAQPAAKSMSKSCKRGKDAEQISREALIRYL